MANLTLVPDFSWSETPEFHTLISSYETGHEQRRNKWANPVRKFTLTFTNRSKTEYETARNFFIARKGAYEVFTWTNPNDSTSYNVRFDGDSFGFTNKSFGLYDFEMKLIEVR